jgi:hypothetical protein
VCEIVRGYEKLTNIHAIWARLLLMKAGNITNILCNAGHVIIFIMIGIVSKHPYHLGTLLDLRLDNISKVGES